MRNYNTLVGRLALLNDQVDTLVSKTDKNSTLHRYINAHDADPKVVEKRLQMLAIVNRHLEDAWQALVDLQIDLEPHE